MSELLGELRSYLMEAAHDDMPVAVRAWLDEEGAEAIIAIASDAIANVRVQVASLRVGGTGRAPNVRDAAYNEAIDDVLNGVNARFTPPLKEFKGG